MGKAISIIVPARNEENTIAMTLESILEADFDGEKEIIVATNDCSDRTEEIVRDLFPQVRLLPIKAPGTSNAINVANRHATYWPRIHVDADVVVSLNSLRELCSEVQKEGIMMATAQVVNDVSGSNLFLRIFNEVQQRHPHRKKRMSGVMYALFEEGGDRSGEIPVSIINYDRYVALHFRREERVTSENARVYAQFPKTIKDYLRGRMRVDAGQIQLKKEHPELMHSDYNVYEGTLKFLLMDIGRVHENLIAASLLVAGKPFGHLKYNFGSVRFWNRAETSKDLSSVYKLRTQEGY